jgi:Glycosyltransferase family 9 (heptosyltransferase)
VGIKYKIWLNDWISLGVSKSVDIPYKGVDHEPQAYLKNNSKFKIFKKYLNKYVLLKLNGQLPLFYQKVPKGAKILWLYVGKRNFGDAIMDISGRALLKNKSVDIDLFTLPHLHKLFSQDDVFGQVYSDLSVVKKNNYDFILLSQFDLPSIRFKAKYFKELPFASLFGFFFGPDRNQTCFSYAGINSIFDLNLSPIEIKNQAKPYLCSQLKSFESLERVITKEPFFTISIGGIDPDRTYRQWLDFLNYLDKDALAESIKNIILVGSDNGIEMSNLLVKEGFKTLKIDTLVGRLTLLETKEIIARSILFIGCDGGLMHVAHTTKTPSLSLFNVNEPHYLRLTKRCYSTPIQSISECNAISPYEILQKLTDKINSLG